MRYPRITLMVIAALVCGGCTTTLVDVDSQLPFMNLGLKIAVSSDPIALEACGKISPRLGPLPAMGAAIKDKLTGDPE